MVYCRIVVHNESVINKLDESEKISDEYHDIPQHMHINKKIHCAVIACKCAFATPNVWVGGYTPSDISNDK